MQSDKKENKADFWVVLGKFGAKFVAIFIKLIKGLKFLKIALMVATFAGYAVWLNWKFAILIMAAVGWHESGHVWAMKRCGLKTKGFYFIPFVGGAAIAKQPFRSYEERAYIGLMGPIWGLGLAVLTYVGFLLTNSTMLAAATGWMSMLNLINLFPVSPFDGGHVLNAIGRSLHKTIGFIMMLAISVISILVLLHMHIMLFVFFGTIGLIELVYEFVFKTKLAEKRYRKLRAEYQERYDDRMKKWPAQEIAWRDLYLNNDDWVKRISGMSTMNIPRMSPRNIMLTAGAYFLTIALLVLMMKAVSGLPGADIAHNFMADR